MPLPELSEVEISVLEALDRCSRRVASPHIYVSARALNPYGLTEETYGLFKRHDLIDGALSRLKQLNLVEQRFETHGGRAVRADHDGYYAILWRVRHGKEAEELLSEWRGRVRPVKRARLSGLAELMG